MTAMATVNRFRRNRGRILQQLIKATAAAAGHSLHILDVGGRADYWDNVGTEGVARITLLNMSIDETDRPTQYTLFDHMVGDACDLSAHADQSVDFVHSNSVIEHVGDWDAMCRMASEARRVGRHGWLQTPAWTFPVEPHWQLPFIHWFGRPAQAKLLRLRRRFRHTPLIKRRQIVDGVNLLSRSELACLFPDDTIRTERFLLLPKSYIVSW
jgi:hypothetical protein